MDKNLEISKMYSGLSEREVLGSIIGEPELVDKALKYITTTNVFYHQDHQNIWGAIYYLHKSNKSIELYRDLMGERHIFYRIYKDE